MSKIGIVLIAFLLVLFLQINAQQTKFISDFVFLL